MTVVGNGTSLPQGGGVFFIFYPQISSGGEAEGRGGLKAPLAEASGACAAQTTQGTCARNAHSVWFGGVLHA